MFAFFKCGVGLIEVKIDLDCGISCFFSQAHLARANSGQNLHLILQNHIIFLYIMKYF